MIRQSGLGAADAVANNVLGVPGPGHTVLHTNVTDSHRGRGAKDAFVLVQPEDEVLAKRGQPRQLVEQSWLVHQDIKHPAIAFRQRPVRHGANLRELEQLFLSHSGMESKQELLEFKVLGDDEPRGDDAHEIATAHVLTAKRDVGQIHLPHEALHRLEEVWSVKSRSGQFGAPLDHLRDLDAEFVENLVLVRHAETLERLLDVVECLKLLQVECS